MGFTESKRAIREVSAAWPTASAKLIENKANGPAIVDELRDEIDGIIAIENNDGVLAHAHAIAPYVEAGNIWIPDPEEWPEVEEWLEEVCAFPNGVNDDRVATLTQAVMRMKGRGRHEEKPPPKAKPSEAVIAAKQKF
jgi:predicted phage terminase large subunit-like protein